MIVVSGILLSLAWCLMDIHRLLPRRQEWMKIIMVKPKWRDNYRLRNPLPPYLKFPYFFDWCSFQLNRDNRTYTLNNFPLKLKLLPIKLNLTEAYTPAPLEVGRIDWHPLIAYACILVRQFEPMLSWYPTTEVLPLIIIPCKHGRRSIYPCFF